MDSISSKLIIADRKAQTLYFNNPELYDTLLKKIEVDNYLKKSVFVVERNE